MDTDAATYPSATLYRWKVVAEGEALRDMGNPQYAEYFPQPPSAIHAPLPRIGGHDYDRAREMLMQAGWQPYMNHWSKGSEWDMTFGNGEYFWKKGYHEIQAACPTGLAQCTFSFKDIYGNTLIVVTAGEAIEELGAVPGVWNWRLVPPEKEEVDA